VEYTIKLEWDSHVNVWIATSDAVPELLELNRREYSEIPLCFKSERRERAYA